VKSERPQGIKKRVRDPEWVRRANRNEFRVYQALRRGGHAAMLAEWERLHAEARGEVPERELDAEEQKQCDLRLYVSQRSEAREHLADLPPPYTGWDYASYHGGHQIQEMAKYLAFGGLDAFRRQWEEFLAVVEEVEEHGLDRFVRCDADGIPPRPLPPEPVVSFEVHSLKNGTGTPRYGVLHVSTIRTRARGRRDIWKLREAWEKDGFDGLRRAWDRYVGPAMIPGVGVVYAWKRPGLHHLYWKIRKPNKPTEEALKLYEEAVQYYAPYVRHAEMVAADRAARARGAAIAARKEGVEGVRTEQAAAAE
jgi:hypothetical protein